MFQWKLNYLPVKHQKRSIYGLFHEISTGNRLNFHENKAVNNLFSMVNNLFSMVNNPFFMVNNPFSPFRFPLFTFGIPGVNNLFWLVVYPTNISPWQEQEQDKQKLVSLFTWKSVEGRYCFLTTLSIRLSISFDWPVDWCHNKKNKSRSKVSRM